jgi:hypothetical protein
VLWGFLNVVIGYLLVLHVGNFDAKSMIHFASLATGALAISLSMARHFGKFHGGNAPERS